MSPSPRTPPRVVRRRSLQVLLLSALLAALAALASACTVAKPIVYVYGDSLTWESQSYISFFFGDRYDVRVLSMGGTALCDYAQLAVDDARRDRPAFVVFAFSGNYMTDCMKGSTNESQAAAKYRSDIDWVVAQFRPLNTPIAFVTPPPGLKRVGTSMSTAAASTSTGTGVDMPRPAGVQAAAQPASGPDWTVGQIPAGFVSYRGLLNATYEQAVAQHRVAGADVGLIDGYSALATAEGSWSKVLPCLPNERSSPSTGCQADGLIHIRAGDLGHFCPGVAGSVGGVVATCDTWSSGAYRYATAIVNYVNWRLDTKLIGALDRVTAGPGYVDVSGWAIDPDGDRDATDIHVHGSQGLLGILAANQNRSDLGAVFPLAGPNHGYAARLAAPPGPQRVCAYAINKWGADAGQHRLVGCQDVLVPDASPIGSLDSAQGMAGAVRVAGWTFDSGSPRSTVSVQLLIDGRAVTTRAAALERPDVARVFPFAGGAHGFDFAYPTTRGSHSVCVKAINIDFGTDLMLRCQTVSAR